MGNLLTVVPEHLSQIPATFWGVVIGSLFTLTGIYFTNRASDLRQREQLKSDREQRNREREMAFRKEIYSAATEAISRSHNSIARICDLTYSMKEISTLSLEQSSIIAKVNLVAREDTIRALTIYGAEFGMAFMRLSQQRMALDVLQAEIAQKVGSLKGFEKARDTMLELMQQHSIDGIQDVRRFETLQSIFDFEASRIATTTQQIQQMTNELVEKHRPLAMQCFADSVRINRLLIPALVAARDELELSISKEQYAEIFYEAQSKVEKTLEHIIQKVDDFRAES